MKSKILQLTLLALLIFTGCATVSSVANPAENSPHPNIDSVNNDTSSMPSPTEEVIIPTPIPTEEPVPTTTNEFVRWFMNVLETQNYDALAQIITDDVYFAPYGTSAQGYPLLNQQETIDEIAHITASSVNCVGYREMENQITIWLNNANWDNDFTKEKTSNGEIVFNDHVLFMVIYVPDIFETDLNNYYDWTNCP